MSDQRTNHIDQAARSAMADLMVRNSWIPDLGPNGGPLRAEIEIALRAAATDAYQRGAGWGLQQHPTTTVNINCPHTEATP